MPFGFLNPALLLGLLGAAVPVVVHLLGRRRAVPRRFPALDFLLASERRLAARRKIRNLLLLFARAMLIAAVALALARPLIRGAVAAGAGEPVSAVLVIDATASMAATVADEVAFERAREQLIEAAERLPTGSEAAVFSLERWPQRLTRGFVPVAEAVAMVRRATVTASAGTIGDVIAEVGLTLDGARRTRRAVYVASDLRATTWSRLERPVDLPAEVVVLDSAAGAIGHDLAVIGVNPTVEDPANLECTLRLTPGGADQVPDSSVVRLLVGGELVNRGVVGFTATADRAPLVARTLVNVPASAARGAELVVEAPVESDPYPINNRWFAYADRTTAVEVVVADGSPSPNLYRDEVFYLQRALEAGADKIQARIIDATVGTLDGLDGADVVILANVPALPAAAIQRLTTFVAAGGGLLVTVGDRADAAALERLGDLVPAHPAAVVAWRDGELPIRIASPDGSVHPVVAPFDTAVTAEALESAVFTHLMAVDPTANGQVVLAYSTGLPALVEGTHGLGRVALLTTTIDRDWSDLPVKPAYLPLISRLVLYLGRALEQPRANSFLVGDRVPLELQPGEVGPLRLFGPDGGERELAEVATGRHIARATGEPGPYRAQLADRREPRLDFVVNVDPAESDLTRVSPEQVQRLLGEAVAVSSDAGSRVAREDEAIWPVLVIAVAAFLLESLLGRRRAEPAVEEAA